MKVSCLEYTMGTCNDVGNRVQLSRQAVFAANTYQWLQESRGGKIWSIRYDCTSKLTWKMA